MLRIEKIIYGTISVRGGTENKSTQGLLRTIKSRAPEFFATHVKSLCLTFTVEIEQAQAILSVCTGLVDLAYWILSKPPLFSFVAQMRPRRLSINVGGLIGESNLQLSHPFFSNITHLRLIDDWRQWTKWSAGFVHLHRLTHLKLASDSFDRDAISSVSTALRVILNGCKSLQVCILAVMSEAKSENLSYHLHDRRLVIMENTLSPVAEWEASICGNRSLCHWLLAEDIINGRL